MPGEDGADGASPGLNEMVMALTGAFKSLSTSRALPAVKLSKFRGAPQRSEELSIREWLDEYDDYCKYYKLDRSERAQVLVAHLVGPAKDEILCRDSEVREDEMKVRKVLQSRFGRLESVQTLTSELHNRAQQDGESLADFSGCLIRLYDRMEAASDGDEKKALKLLRDSTLKERFIKGVRDKQIQRELRRVAVTSSEQSFLGMRETVLELFQDVDSSPTRIKVRECEVEAARAATTIEEPSLRGEIANLKETLCEVVQTLQSLKQGSNSRQGFNSRNEMKCYNCGKSGHLRKDCDVPVKCYGCNGVGHIRKDCPKESRASGLNESTNSDIGPGVSQGAAASIRVVNDHGAARIRADLVARSPTATVEIAGEEARCILDTGAEASLMPQKYYETHLRSKVGPLTEIRGGIQVSGVSGKDVPILGCVRVQVRACRHSADVGFLVVREGSLIERQEDYPIILGCNALRVLLQGGNKDTPSRGDWGLVSQTLGTSMAAEVDELRVGDPVVVSPVSIRSIVCKTQEAGSRHGNHIVDEPNPLGYADNGKVSKGPLTLVQGCEQVQCPQVAINVANDEEEIVPGKDEIIGEEMELEPQKRVVFRGEDSEDMGVCNSSISRKGTKPKGCVPYQDRDFEFAESTQFAIVEANRGKVEMVLDKDEIYNAIEVKENGHLEQVFIQGQSDVVEKTIVDVRVEKGVDGGYPEGVVFDQITNADNMNYCAERQKIVHPSESEGILYFHEYNRVFVSDVDLGASRNFKGGGTHMFSEVGEQNKIDGFQPGLDTIRLG